MRKIEAVANKALIILTDYTLAEAKYVINKSFLADLLKCAIIPQFYPK